MRISVYKADAGYMPCAGCDEREAADGNLCQVCAKNWAALERALDGIPLTRSLDGDADSSHGNG